MGFEGKSYITCTASPGVKTLVKTCRGSVIGILPRETPDTLHGIGEGREGEHPRRGISLPTRICLWGGGSRHRVVENYIFGSQPCVQKGHHQEGGRPQDVKKKQTQV